MNDEQTSSLNDQIAAAVKEGYTMDEIAKHLATSENPEHKAWSDKWLGVQQPAAPASSEQQPATANAPLTEFINEHPVQAGITAGAAYGALKAPGIYNAHKERQIQNRKLDIEERRLSAYEEQVARQGMPSQQPSIQQPSVQAELSPLEQARIETERVRAEAIKQKIALAEAKAAREEAAAKARAEAESAKKATAAQQKTAVPPLPDKDAEMLGNSMRAAQQKAIDADQKAIAAKAAVPQAAAAVQQTAPVVPPVQTQAGPTVQLTPAPEVKAEGIPPAHPLEGGKQLTTGTGKPAYAGGAEPTGKFKSEYKNIMEVPSTHAWIPEGQQIDMLRNALSQPTYTEEFSKRAWPTEYKGEKGSLEVSKEINRALGRPTREEALAQGIAKEKIGEPTKGILQKVNNKTLVKVGGIAGALTAIPNLSQAAQQKDVGKVADILTDFLVPMFAESHVAGMPRKQEESIIAEKFKEAQKLGSPYRSVPPPKR